MDIGIDDLERRRLQALVDLEILDTPAEEAFDRLTKLAADLFDTPIAAISLIDETRQWFKSRVGLDSAETPREIAFCQYTIRGDSVLEVQDALEDATFAENPLVTGDPNIRFYAGAPIRLASGLNMGAFCVIDTRPRQLSDLERRRLQAFAQIAVDEMELRLKTRQLEIARAEAEAAAQAKADFLANMSHELRSPLTSIIGFAGLMVAGDKLQEPERRFAERIKAAGQHLLEVVNDVLDYSKLEAGQIELAPEDAPLRPLVDEVAEMFRERALAKGVGFDWSVDPSVPDVIRTDPHALRQVLINLVSNAVKFTEAGAVTLTADMAPDGRLSIKVRDSGLGIAADRLEQIFERFAQADSSISRRYGGTGLGLSISQQLAALLGGSLSVSSTLGEGSLFELKLLIP